MNSTALSLTHLKSETVRAALALLLVGFSLVFLTGFSHTDNVHNAAHDTRHALSFPCH